MSDQQDQSQQPKKNDQPFLPVSPSPGPPPLAGGPWGFSPSMPLGTLPKPPPFGSAPMGTMPPFPMPSFPPPPGGAPPMGPPHFSPSFPTGTFIPPPGSSAFPPMHSLPQPYINKIQPPNIPNTEEKDKEIQQLKGKLLDKEREIRNLLDEKEELQRSTQKFKKQITELEEKYQQSDNELRKLRIESGSKFTTAPKPDQSNLQILQLENQKQELTKQLSLIEEQSEANKRQVWELKRLNQQYVDDIQNKVQQIESMKKTAESQTKQIEILRKAQGSNQENQLQFQQQFEKEVQSNKVNTDFAILREENAYLQQKIKDCENEKQDIINSNEKTTRLLSEQRAQLRSVEAQMFQLQQEMSTKDQQIDSLKFEITQLINNIDDQKIRKEKLQQQEKLNKIYDDQKKFQQVQQDYEKQQYQIQQKKLQQMQQQGIDKQIALNLQGQDKIRALRQKIGKIQCLYITDFPKNKDKVQSSIISSVRQCCDQIKKKTGRDSFWGAISYGAKQAGNVVKQFDQNPYQVESFLMGQSKFSVSFEDKPEDLKQALIDASKLEWSEKIKLAIIISTSPCHGKQYHHLSKYKTWWFFEKKYDTKPDDKIEEAIVNLIRKDIVVLGIRYSSETEVMYNEFSKIYQKHGKPELFFTLQIKDMSNYKEIVEKISEMTEHLAGVNIQTTKTKVNQTQRQANYQPSIQDMKEIKKEVVQQSDQFAQEAKGKKIDKDTPEVSTEVARNDQIQYEEEVKKLDDCKDGALEALCKRGDFWNFERRAETVQFQCNAIRIEMKNGVFDQKKEKIYDLKPDDFDCVQENTWTCIRTKNPFAFGMMKKVYIMQKKGVQDELYVVKVPIKTGPYNNKQEAILDCRSHLISKQLMNEFMFKIKQKPQKLAYPDVIYTDFLILEELNQGKPTGWYWLAEKFFKGEFKKYNNNDGYICSDEIPLNKLAQAFSYYTYQASGFNYIVNDVQGVGNYFTDPAINTTEGKFDETDGGEEGIGNFLTVLQIKANLCTDLLKSINIEMD